MTTILSHSVPEVLVSNALETVTSKKSNRVVTIFNGERYKLSSEGYFRGVNKHTMLHRDIWTFFIGEIPKGSVVHHIDHDRTNNNISNLLLMTHEDHCSHHAKERVRDNHPAYVNFRAISKALKRGPKPKVTAICVRCGKEFQSDLDSIKKGFCGSTCGAAERRESKIDNAPRECVICKSLFIVNKHFDTKTCSKPCFVELSKLNAKIYFDAKREMFPPVTTKEIVCVVCGNTFVARKHNPGKTCGNDCKIKLCSEVRKAFWERKRLEKRAL